MGGRRRLEGDLTPGRRRERGTDWCRQAPCSSSLCSLRTPNTFPTFCSLKAFRGLICGVQWGAERRPLFGEAFPRRGHYDPSERIKTPFVRPKPTRARLLRLWKAGAWETVHKYAFSPRWLPGHLVSLQAVFPFKCALFPPSVSLLHISLSVPYANLSVGRRGWRKEDGRTQVQMNLGTVVFLLEGFKWDKRRRVCAGRTVLQRITGLSDS